MPAEPAEPAEPADMELVTAAAWAMGQQREPFAVPPWRFGVLDVGAHGMARNHGSAACEPAERSFAVYRCSCLPLPTRKLRSLCLHGAAPSGQKHRHLSTRPPGMSGAGRNHIARSCSCQVPKYAATPVALLRRLHPALRCLPSSDGQAQRSLTHRPPRAMAAELINVAVVEHILSKDDAASPNALARSGPERGCPQAV
ncbi:hypothetical protein HBH49_104250 [Parastagonospora nodorum]|nr:hypothetical protein HBH49_104250 [Parastagonospora nodorum]KAH5301237.1 hypothetical protein HBI11_143350 [Parastagonospora nodorum]KAH5375676.1 hypothetical protein HBI33_163560 [Parastagonospora nodorum]